MERTISTTVILLQAEAELPFEFPVLHIEIPWAMNIIKTRLVVQITLQ